MRRLPLILFSLVCFFSVSLGYAWWQLAQVKKAHEAQVKHNQELVYRNAALQADISDLRNGVEAVQERARLQLGMIKRDEVFVQVMDQPSAAQAQVNTIQETPVSPKKGTNEGSNNVGVNGRTQPSAAPVSVNAAPPAKLGNVNAP